MLITETQKNTKERIRVSIEEYKGHQFVDLRVYFEDSQGEWRPSRKGIALNADCIYEVIQGLQTAGRELERALTPKADHGGRKGAGKSSEPLTDSVLAMLRTIGTGHTMTRKDLQAALNVCDKSLRRYVDQARKGGHIQIEGRGPEQRIRVIGLRDRLDNGNCPELSDCPEAEKRTEETIH